MRFYLSSLFLLSWCLTASGQSTEVYLNQGRIHVNPILIEKQRILIDHDWKSGLSFWDIDRSMLLKRFSLQNQFQAGLVVAQEPTAVSATGKFLVTETNDSTFIYDVPTQTLVNRFLHPGKMNNPGPRIRAFIDEDRVLMQAIDNKIRFTSTATWKTADAPSIILPDLPVATVTGDHLLILRDEPRVVIRDFQFKNGRLDSTELDLQGVTIKSHDKPTLIPCSRDRVVLLWQGGKTTSLMVYDLNGQKVLFNQSIPAQTSYHRIDRSSQWLAIYSQPYGDEAVNMFLIDLEAGKVNQLTLSDQLKKGLKNVSAEDVRLEEGNMMVNCPDEKMIRGIHFHTGKEWKVEGELNFNWLHTSAGKLLYRTEEDKQAGQYRTFNPEDGTNARLNTGSLTYIKLHNLSGSGRIQVIEKHSDNHYRLGAFDKELTFKPEKWLGSNSVPLTGYVTGKAGDKFLIRLARPSTVVDADSEFIDFGSSFMTGFNTAEPYVSHELSTGESEALRMVSGGTSNKGNAWFQLFNSRGDFGEQVDSIQLHTSGEEKPVSTIKGAVMELFGYYVQSLSLAKDLQLTPDRNTLTFLINTDLWAISLSSGVVVGARKTDLQKVTGKYLLNTSIRLLKDNRSLILQAGTASERDVFRFSLPELELTSRFNRSSEIILSGTSYPFLLILDKGRTELWNMDARSKVKAFPWKKPDWIMNSISAMFNEEGTAFLIHEASGNLSMYSTAGGKLIYEWNDPGQIKVVAFRGDRIYCIGPSGIPFQLDIRSGVRSGFTASHPVGQMVESTFIEEGDSLLLTSGAGAVYFWNLTNRKLFRRLFLIDSLHFLTMDDSLHYTTAKESTGAVLLRRGTTVSSVDQFDLILNRPSLFSSGKSEYAMIRKRLLEKAYEKRLRISGVKRGTAGDLQVDVTNKAELSSFPATSSIGLRLTFRGVKSLLSSIHILVNDVPLTGRGGRKTHTLDTTVMVNLSMGYNRVDIYGLDTNGNHSNHFPMHFFRTATSAVASKTWFIGIGIDRFADVTKNLSWSVKDIRDLASMMKEKIGDALVIDTLFNRNVTIEKVSALKKKLAGASVDDNVIVAYSGHGLLNGEMDYFLSTYSVNFSQPEKNGLPYKAFESLFHETASRRRLMLIDACHSGELDPESLPAMNQIQARINPSAKAVTLTVDGNRTIGIKPSFELMKELFTEVGRQT
ncbi:MAG: caspase family protein, partial [Bacteroidota bacterium]